MDRAAAARPFSLNFRSSSVVKLHSSSAVTFCVQGLLRTCIKVCCTCIWNSNRRRGLCRVRARRRRDPCRAWRSARRRSCGISTEFQRSFNGKRRGAEETRRGTRRARPTTDRPACVFFLSFSPFQCSLMFFSVCVCVPLERARKMRVVAKETQSLKLSHVSKSWGAFKENACFGRMQRKGRVCRYAHKRIKGFPPAALSAKGDRLSDFINDPRCVCGKSPTTRTSCVFKPSVVVSTKS